MTIREDLHQINEKLDRVIDGQAEHGERLSTMEQAIRNSAQWRRDHQDGDVRHEMNQRAENDKLHGRIDSVQARVNNLNGKIVRLGTIISGIILGALFLARGLWGWLERKLRGG